MNFLKSIFYGYFQTEKHGNEMMTRALAIPLLVISIGLGATHADIVNVTGITGHDGGNWPSWHGHLTDGINASDATLIDPGDGPTSGMTLVDVNDPSTWTWSGDYKKTWHANSILDSGTSLNSKIGWLILDFGTVVDGLDNLYMWASSTGQTGGGTEQVRNYNLYYSSGVGIDALPAMPQSKGTTGDYDFSSGDWTSIGSNTLGTADGAVSNTNALGSNAARYIGIEIMTIGGVDTRMAIAQFEVTYTPRPPAKGTFFRIK